MMALRNKEKPLTPSEALEASAPWTEELDAFLLDPIGYGTYDYLDPINLDDFMLHHPVHSDYIGVLT